MPDDLPATPPRRITREIPYLSHNGYWTTAAAVVLIALGASVLARHMAPWYLGIALLLVAFVLLVGLYMLQPNEAVILTLFGKYQGTDRTEGLRWRNPLQSGTKISLRARNLNTSPLKVNDKRGNPVEIGAAVVWRVHDTAQAVFDIDDYTRFVSVQAEAAIRHLATLYAYDTGEDLAPDETTLRAGLDVVANALKDELNLRFASAGVEVVDAKLTHLAYAPDRARHVAAPAGDGHRQRAPPDRRRRSGHGGGGAHRPVRTQPRRAGRRTQGRDGLQPACRAVLRSRCAARDQHRHALHVTHARRAAPMASPGKKAFPLRIDPVLWAEVSGRRSNAWPRRNCAAPMRRWNSCCARRWHGAGASR
jgi:hypothetical protein